MSVPQQQIKALANFRNALRRFLAFSETATRESGVTTQQYQALLAIKAREPDSMRLSDLADELLMKNAAAVQLVDRLQANKFVVRELSLIDGRSTIIRLTRAGEAILLKLVSLHLAQLARRKKQFGAIFRQLKDISSE